MSRDKRAIKLNQTNTHGGLEVKTYIGNITFDVAHPKEMAEFWAAALHYDVQEAADTWAAIVDPKGVSPRVYFQQPPTPKTGKNRIHLDLNAADMEAEVERLVSLGAQKLRVSGDEGEIWTVMADPEGVVALQRVIL